MSTAIPTRPTLDQLWSWLGDVHDPEIPVLSIVDLGIVRDVAWIDDQCTVTVTPTYSGCPAIDFIKQQIQNDLRGHGVEDVRLQVQLSPAWTTDWLTEKGKRSLQEYGIAPPVGRADVDIVNKDFPLLPTAPEPAIPCPHCGSTHTERLSQFGSTPCKSLHRCTDCQEPFDYFKCH